MLYKAFKAWKNKYTNNLVIPPNQLVFSSPILKRYDNHIDEIHGLFKVVDGADVVVSGNQGKDGSLNVGLSVKPDESSEARKKKDNGMGALIAAAVMKIGLLKALAFKALVFLVGKALLVSKVTLPTPHVKPSVLIHVVFAARLGVGRRHRLEEAAALGEARHLRGRGPSAPRTPRGAPPLRRRTRFLRRRMGQELRRQGGPEDGLQCPDSRPIGT